MERNRTGKPLHERRGEDGRGKRPVNMTILFRGKVLVRDKSGNSTPTIIALILGLLFLICAVSEFSRLMIITQGVRDGLQQAVISVATTNYDETYRALREGYSGGYRLAEGRWVEDLDYDDVYYRLDNFIVLRGVTEDGKIYVADLASYSRSEKAWDLSVIMEEAHKTAGSGGTFWAIGK